MEKKIMAMLAEKEAKLTALCEALPKEKLELLRGELARVEAVSLPREKEPK